MFMSRSKVAKLLIEGAIRGAGGIAAWEIYDNYKEFRKRAQEREITKNGIEKKTTESSNTIDTVNHFRLR